MTETIGRSSALPSCAPWPPLSHIYGSREQDEKKFQSAKQRLIDHGEDIKQCAFDKWEQRDYYGNLVKVDPEQYTQQMWEGEWWNVDWNDTWWTWKKTRVVWGTTGIVRGCHFSFWKFGLVRISYIHFIAIVRIDFKKL